MDWSEPATAVMSAGTAAVLRALAGSDGSFAIREVARLAGISSSRAHQVVTNLAAHGIVIVDSRRGSRLVRLNDDHVATEHAVALATLRTRVIEQIRKELSGWKLPAVHASLYGSAARGDGSTDSDLDILVIHEPLSSATEQEEWDDQLAQSAEMIHTWTGNWASWFQVTEAELSQMATSNHSLIAEWRRDAITLVGPSLAALLRKRS